MRQPHSVNVSLNGQPQILVNRVHLTIEGRNEGLRGVIVGLPIEYETSEELEPMIHIELAFDALLPSAQPLTPDYLQIIENVPSRSLRWVQLRLGLPRSSRRIC